MGRWARTREYETPRTTKTNFIDTTIKSTIALVVRSREMSCAVFSRRRWRHLRENCRIKIASKNRNCGDAKFFFYIFCRQKQTISAKSERFKGRGLAILCRRRKIYAMIGETVRVEIGPILRTDFCRQDSYSSIDDSRAAVCWNHETLQVGLPSDRIMVRSKIYQVRRIMTQFWITRTRLGMFTG